MNAVKINSAKQYDVLVENGCFKNAGQLVKNIFPQGKIMIVTDSTVKALYADALVESLKAQGFSDVFVFSFPAGEHSYKHRYSGNKNQN